MIQDKMKPVGTLEIVLSDEHGNIKEVRKLKNIITTLGLGWIAARMGGVGGGLPLEMSYMSIGTGTTAAVASQTTLVTESTRSPLSSTVVSAATVTYTATFGAGYGTGAVTEAGIFNDPAAGTMLNRTTFAAINKGASDTISITWVVTLQ
jgi:hypothetical protein